MTALILMSIMLILIVNGVQRNPTALGWLAVFIHTVSTILTGLTVLITSPLVVGILAVIPLIWMALLIVVMVRYVRAEASFINISVFVSLLVTFGFIISNIVRIS